MYFLRLLGGLSLTAGNAPVPSPLVQRRRLALLALLAATPRGRLGREKLCTYLWPDADEESARHRLTDALHALRKGLGHDAVLSAGDELQLNSDVVQADVVLFRSALGAGEPERAAQLYEGPFLDGFYLSGAAELERWAEVERDDLARAYAEALEAAAARAEAAGDAPRAICWWRRLAAHDPLSTRVALRLIAALHRAGDHAAALQHARTHAALLEEELGGAPDAEFLAEVERLRAPRTADAAHPPAALPQPAHDALSGRPGPVAVSALAERRDHPRRRRFGRGVALAGVIGLSFGGVSLGLRGFDTTQAAAGVPTLAVLPFRVGGADPALAYLHEGLPDLLASKLNGPHGPRAIDPGATIAMWRRQGGSAAGLDRTGMQRVARALGASDVLVGGVVGAPSQLVVRASLLRVSDGATRAEASVVGPADSLLVMIDRLVAELLVRDAGELDARLSDLTTRSLPALRSYLEGRQAYRRGDFVEARQQLLSAVWSDSTFGLAALLLAETAGWLRDDAARNLGKRLAWARREQLGPEDAAYLRALAGPAYPAPSSWLAQLRAWEEARDAAPDRAEAWYGVGDHLYHYGAALGVPGARNAAERAFERAAAINPRFTPAFLHLADLAVERGDAAAAQAWLDRDSVQWPAYLRWRLSLASGDSSVLREIRARLEELPTYDLLMIVQLAQADARGLADAVRAADILSDRPTSTADRSRVLQHLVAFAQNRGRPAEAARIATEIGGPSPRGHGDLQFVLAHAAHARTEVPEALSTTMAMLLAPSDGQARSELPAEDRCALEHWRLASGDTTMVDDAIDALAHHAAYETHAPRRELCAAMLAALLAHERGDARDARMRLDSLLRSGPPTGFHTLTHDATLALARLQEAGGSATQALATLARRTHFTNAPWHLATFLREDGRLALIAGDTARAVSAYRHYLALRDDPEPALAAEVSEIHCSLAELQRRTTPARN